jgi:hypothetical protein
MIQSDTDTETKNELQDDTHCNKKQNKRAILVRFSDEEYAKILAIARETDSSLSRILRLAVRQYIKEWERKNAQNQ